jgi:deazaflavin-dependent oxidoreductase (nitroreductase family)
MKIVKRVRPPTGPARLAFRLPITLYRAGLGWIFGNRLLLLNHIGRITGRPRRAVLEVVTHEPTDGSYVVASGLGPTASWYRNVVHAPDVTIQVGRRTIPVTAVPVPAGEGAEIFVRYAARHRATARFLLSRLMGIAVDGSQEDFRLAGQHIPFIRLTPRA